MNIFTKISLTIPPILSIGYFVTFASPSDFAWLFPTMKSYNIQMIILWGLNLFQLIYLINKLWSFKEIDKSIKNEWTWILIFFSAISSLIFIWQKHDKLAISNRT